VPEARFISGRNYNSGSAAANLEFRSRQLPFLSKLWIAKKQGRRFEISGVKMTNSQNSVGFALSQLNEDEGKYRVIISKIATSKSK
jgi:hypothetical protein